MRNLLQNQKQSSSYTNQHCFGERGIFSGRLDICTFRAKVCWFFWVDLSNLCMHCNYESFLLKLIKVVVPPWERLWINVEGVQYFWRYRQYNGVLPSVNGIPSILWGDTIFSVRGLQWGDYHQYCGGYLLDIMPDVGYEWRCIKIKVDRCLVGSNLNLSFILKMPLAQMERTKRTMPSYYHM